MANSVYINALEKVCVQLKPTTVLEFGSGSSTEIFASHGARVTTIEYSPPGDWHNVSRIPNIELVLVDQEEGLSPVNLFHVVFSLIKRKLPSDIYQEQTIVRSAPLWDLVFIDSARHVRGQNHLPGLPGFCGGDISYLDRAALAGVGLQVGKYVLIDDAILSMPKFTTLDEHILDQRLTLITGTHNI